MTGIFKWGFVDSVGVELFDKQHKRIIAMINQLHQSILNRESHLVLAQILQEMLDYSEVHFWHEEVAMEKYGYPEYDLQRKAHKNFIAKIKEFQDKFRKKEAKLEVSIIDFLFKWWMNHIRICDKKYEQFFKGKEIHFSNEDIDKKS